MRLAFGKIVLSALAVAAAAKGVTIAAPGVLPLLARSGQAHAEAPPTPAPLLEAEPARCETLGEAAALIEEERALLAKQTEEMEARAAKLALAEESLNADRERLDALRGEIESQITRVEDAYGKDLSKLVALYQNMKPAIAAGIMNELDLETAVLVLSAMPERDAAQILGAVSVDRARAVSKIILERARLPGDQNLTGIPVR